MTYEAFRHQWENSSSNIECYTSGSTGKPSLIELPKLQMRKSAVRTLNFFNLGSGSHLHSCISPDYIGGKMMMVRSIEANCTFSYETPSNHIFSNYRGSSIDLAAVVPSQMTCLLNDKRPLPPVRHYLIGGAPISDSLRKLILEAEVSAWETYGMTETSSHIALRKITSEESPFQTLPEITVSNDCRGCLVINIEEWQEFLTNDLAIIYSDKTFEITGREDNVINSGGKKIHPELLEKKLSSILKCDFALTSRPDPLWGEKLILVIAKYKNYKEDIREVENICRRNLERHEVPKEIIKTETIPLTDNGKIDREKLKTLIDPV